MHSDLAFADAAVVVAAAAPAWETDPRWKEAVAEVERLSSPEANRPSGTEDPYERYQRLWTRHCTGLGCDPLAASLEVWKAFMAGVFDGGVSLGRDAPVAPSTLTVMLAAVSDLYRNAGVLPVVRQPEHVADWRETVEGYEREYARVTGSSSSREPIRPLTADAVKALLAVTPQPMSAAWTAALVVTATDTAVSVEEAVLLTGDSFTPVESGVSITTRTGVVEVVHRSHRPGCWSAWCPACVLLDAVDMDGFTERVSSKDVSRLLGKASRSWSRLDVGVLCLRPWAVTQLRTQVRTALAWTCGLPATAQMPVIARSAVTVAKDGGVTVTLDDDRSWTLTAASTGDYGVADAVRDWLELWDTSTGDKGGEFLFPDLVGRGGVQVLSFARSPARNREHYWFKELQRAAGIDGFTLASVQPGFAVTATEQGFDEADIAAAVQATSLTRVSRWVAQANRGTPPIQALLEARRKETP